LVAPVKLLLAESDFIEKKYCTDNFSYIYSDLLHVLCSICIRTVGINRT